MGTGPLSGVRILEFASLGPGPFACMLLTDMGADVVRIDRRGSRPAGYDVTTRGRRSIALDLKSAGDRDLAEALSARADVLVEGNRPGVMERLGLGPEQLMAANARLIYARMTGWGQSGPLANRAGHDINYIALSGALHAIGPRSAPVPPLNLVGDYGGGALYLAMGICAALVEQRRSGLGQIIDCAMTDGAASLMAPFFAMHAFGAWVDQRESNGLDGAAPFYSTYETADGKWVAVGALEAQFYQALWALLGLPGEIDAQTQWNRSAWPWQREQLEAAIRTKSAEELDALLSSHDVCCARILSIAEAPFHHHNVARNTFVEIEGVMQPNAAPRFSRTPAKIQGPPSMPDADRDAIMADWLGND